MKAVIQRVHKASVTINDAETVHSSTGFVVFLGIHQKDSIIDAEWICGKIARLRIFEDDEGAMNRSIIETKGDILLISQFTLLANNRKGNRPSFNDAAKPSHAIPLYQNSIQLLERLTQRPVHTGEFGAHMDVQLINNGPVTILLDSHKKE